MRDEPLDAAADLRRRESPVPRAWPKPLQGLTTFWGLGLQGYVQIQTAGGMNLWRSVRGERFCRAGGSVGRHSGSRWDGMDGSRA